MDGEGTFFIEGTTYSLNSTWKMGEPEYRANTYTTQITSPVEDQKEQPKDAKGKPPAKGVPVQEENTGSNELKVAIDVKNPDESKRVLSIEIEIKY